MMKSVLALILIVGMVVCATAQGRQAIELQVPAGDGAWAIRVLTSGGFDGRGRGNVTLTSLGDLACDGPVACGTKLTGGSLQALAQRIG